MHYPLTDIQANFEINRPIRYQITAKRNYFHRRYPDGRTDGTTNRRCARQQSVDFWKKNTKNKISKSIRILYKVRPYSCTGRLRNIYVFFIYSYLRYCNEVWGNACSTHIDPIIKLQTRAVRTITFIIMLLCYYIYNMIVAYISC